MKILNNKGFTLIELLLAIAVLASIGLIVMPSLTNFQKKQSLKNTAENIVTLLNKAKSDSLSSLNSNNYGVHFESNQMIYFTGNNFSPGNINNKKVGFASGVVIPPIGGIGLNNGGNDVIFPRLTGDVVGYGIIVIQLISKPTSQEIITINKLGTISLTSLN